MAASESFVSGQPHPAAAKSSFPALETVTYFDGRWTKGPAWLMSSTTNGAWLGNVVFDGARAFEGVTPDLEHHCRRVVRSARGLGMVPPIEADTVLDLVHEGLKQFAPGSPIYIRPMFWIETGIVVVDPLSTRFALVLQKVPLPDPEVGFTACLSRWRKPTQETAPTHVKASCLYPACTMAVAEAMQKGFDNAIVLDAMGNVAEFAMQNLFWVRDGEIHTPQINGSFLDGVTRQRVIGLLRAEGVTVHERILVPDELFEAEEMFSTGNHGRVLPLTRFEDRQLGIGPVFRRVRELYWDFALAGRELPLG